MKTELISIFEKMIQSHIKHLARLNNLKNSGASLQLDFQIESPDHKSQSLDDFIKREQNAIDNLSYSLAKLSML